MMLYRKSYIITTIYHLVITEKFLLDLENCFKKISNQPEGFQKRYKNVRAAYLKNFPIGVFYIIFSKEIRVIAILHSSRNPEVWKKR
jgi:plasmid stabilization system protein ParE